MIYSAKNGEYSLEKTIEMEGSYPRSIDYLNGKILIGLRNGNIVEVDETREDKKHIMASHHEGETWGIEVVPENHTLLSIGDDNKIMDFDYELKKFNKRGTIAENPS